VIPEVRVLNGGFVRLVEFMGDDLSIVRAARVSYQAAWRAGKDENSDAKLIRSLMQRGHTSPFEAVQLKFDVRAPIFVLRQWHRHRTWSYNEVSARYSELDMGFYEPEQSVIGGQHPSEKQGRINFGHSQQVDGGGSFNPVAVQSRIRDHNMKGFTLYKDLLEQGVSRELARIVLSVSAYSQMFASVNLHNLFNFVRLRSDPHAQYEIRVYSDAMLKLAKMAAPIAVQEFINSNWIEGEGPEV
jgi:thymidylate synthase (FAD)